MNMSLMKEDVTRNTVLAVSALLAPQSLDHANTS